VTRGVLPYAFSVARGVGIDTEATTKLLRSHFGSTGITPKFSAGGPDLSAISKEEWWQVECKGAGAGKPQTQRNNFDRALASVVSYFEETPPTDNPLFREAKPFLGLALPATSAYLGQLKRRVRQSLRKRLNLWVLIVPCEEPSLDVRVVQPDQDY
jgi:hypothetical protein